MTCGIYCMTNSVNGKVYVGQSINVERRIRAHRYRLASGVYRGNIHLQRAWSKYGAANFCFSLLEACVPESLEARERHWIRALDSMRSGYNKSPGGAAPMLGKKMSTEQKSRIAASMRGKKKTKEHARKVADAQRGQKRQPLSAEHKAVLSASIRKGWARYEVEGERVSLLELSRRFGFSSSALWKRMNRNGESVEEALRTILFNRDTKPEVSRTALAHKLGVPQVTFCRWTRMHGMDAAMEMAEQRGAVA